MSYLQNNKYFHIPDNMAKFAKELPKSMEIALGAISIRFSVLKKRINNKIFINVLEEYIKATCTERFWLTHIAIMYEHILSDISESTDDDDLKEVIKRLKTMMALACHSYQNEYKKTKQFEDMFIEFSIQDFF